MEALAARVPIYIQASENDRAKDAASRGKMCSRRVDGCMHARTHAWGSEAERKNSFPKFFRSFLSFFPFFLSSLPLQTLESSGLAGERWTGKATENHTRAAGKYTERLRCTYTQIRTERELHGTQTASGCVDLSTQRATAACSVSGDRHGKCLGERRGLCVMSLGALLDGG